MLYIIKPCKDKFAEDLFIFPLQSTIINIKLLSLPTLVTNNLYE